MFKKLLYVASLVLVLSSCAKEDLVENEDVVGNDSTAIARSVGVKDTLKADFARVLSKVVYENRSVREFLKAEAVKQFDKNYDVLYVAIKDEPVGNKTFRELLVDASSEEFMRDVEKEIPLLNILFPKLFMFGLSPENYDSNDDELPVAVSQAESNDLYFNGECTDHLVKGEIPGFYTLVVNENNRVIVGSDTRSGESAYRFKHPEYNGLSHPQNASTRSAITTSDVIGNKAIQAYSYFYDNNSGVHSRALQRDYIYYGMTSTSQQGPLNQSISEYLCFIEVNPTTYYTITDDLQGQQKDPSIKTDEVSKEDTDFTEAELLDQFWTSGAYNFVFEVMRSNDNEAISVHVPARPDELWNFNLTRIFQHKTWFRPRKYTYQIHLSDFTSKRMVFAPGTYSFGKWDISHEALTRHITVLEEDKTTNNTNTQSYQFYNANSTLFSGTTKNSLGLKIDPLSLGNTSGVITELNDSTSTAISRTISYAWNTSSDILGQGVLYFYDPIIESTNSDGTYNIRTFTYGGLTFAVSAY